jgi:hypothetical protein
LQVWRVKFECAMAGAMMTEGCYGLIGSTASPYAIKLRAIKLARCCGCKQKRMGPGALEHRGAPHLRLCEGFLVHTSNVSGSDSAWPLRSSPVNVFEFSKAQ